MYERLRNVGKLEQFSTARHSLGYYRCVAQTARYCLDVALNEDELRQLLINSLRKVVVKHAALCCGIVDEHTKTPYFIRPAHIDLNDCLTIKTSGAEQETHDEMLTRLLKQRHSELWQDLDNKPPWHLTVVKDGGVTQKAKFDAAFAFHHAIFDGLGGLRFHYDLLQALREGDLNVIEQPILELQSVPHLSKPIEELVTFPISWTYLMQQIWIGFAPTWLRKPPDVWAGNVTSLFDKAHYPSQIHLITIPTRTAAKLISGCRTEKATVTGLIHGCIVASLTALVPSATSFAATTPYNLRPLTGASELPEMVVQVSAMNTTYDADCVESMRVALDDEDALEQRIWLIARRFREEMAAEKARLSKDNPLGLLPYVGDWHQFLRSQFAKPRPNTFEVSNVGVLAPPAPEGGGSGSRPLLTARIDRCIFSQSGAMTDKAMSISVASVKDGPLTLCFSWLEGVMETPFVHELGRKIDQMLTSIAED